MIAPIQDAVRFDTFTEITWTQMVHATGLSETELGELVQYGALVPRDPSAPVLTFEARWLVVGRKASRLRRELDLDSYGVSVVLSFQDRIESLEAELRALRARRR